MRRRVLPDLWIILLLFILPLILFAPVTLGDRTLIPADNLYQWEPFATYREVVSAPDVPQNALLSDLLLENAVWKQFIRSSITGGEIPLWNPYLFAGVPFLAAGQHSALYPLSALFYVLPLEAAYGWYTVIQLWLAGVFMYLFARGLGQARIGGAVAAVSWQLSGWFIVRVVFPMILGAAAWLPLLLLMVEYVIRTQPLFGRPATLPWAAIGAVALGMVIYAGHVEITYYTLLIMAYYAAARLLVGWWRGRRKAGTAGRLLRRGIWLAVMVMLGLLIGAAQLLPLFELVQHNFREGSATLEQILGWAYPLRRIVAFFMPNFFGSPAHHTYWDVFSGQVIPATVNVLGQPIHTIDWGIKNYVEGGAYLGILPMALAVFGLLSAWWTRKARQPGRPYRAIFAVLGAFSLTFIFGLPTYAVLYYLLPGINQLHSPFRWVFALTLSVAVLAGYGADALARSRGGAGAEAQRASGGATGWSPRGGESAPPAPAETNRAAFRSWRSPQPTAFSPADRWARRIGWGLFWTGAVLLVVLLLSRVFYPQLEPLVDRAFHALAKAELAFADVHMFYSYEFRNILLLGLFLIASGVVFRVSRCPIYVPRRLGGRPVWEWLVVLVIALDLLTAFWGFNPAVDPALLSFTPPAVEWLQGRYEQDGPFRITTLDAPGEALLNANIPWMFGLEDVRGYDSIIPRQYTDYMALISPQFQLEFNRVAPLTTDHLEALDSPLLDLLNVRYVVTRTPVENPSWVLAYEDEAVRIYENQRVMPRAYTLPARASLTYSDGQDFADRVQSVDPRHVVMIHVQDAPPDDGIIEPGEPAAQAIVEYRNIQVTVEAVVDGPSWLVLVDSDFPGWRAYIRPAGSGEDFELEIPVERVNGNFRGVMIDPDVLADHYAPQAAEGTVTLSDTWLVRFRYSPPGFQIGAFLSFIAGAVIVFALGVWLWRTFYLGRDESEDETVRRLAKNSIMPIVMNLFNKGIDFAFAFIMLRVLGPEGAGIYYYAIVIFGWFDILTNFGLNTYLTREVARHRDQAGRYLFNTSVMRLALAVGAVPLLIAFLLARQTAISPPLDMTAIIAIGLLYVGLLPNSLSTGLSALFYAFEKAEYPAAVATVGTISKATLGLGALLLGWGVIGLAGVSIITNLIVLAVLLWTARGLIWPQRYGREPAVSESLVSGWRIDRALLRHMTAESWPLMINHLLATIFFKIDVVLMEPINGVNVVGWYSTAYKWLDALNIIPAFLSAALLPVMSRQAHEDPPALVRSYRLSVKLLLMTALPVAVATTFIARALILTLGGPEFLPDGAVALQLMIWSIPIGWINSVTQYVLIALDRQRVLTRAFAIAVIFNITANLIFLPVFSYRAAAVITIFSEALLLALFLRVLQSTLHQRIPGEAALSTISLWQLFWKPGLAAAVMLGVLALLWGVNALLALAVAVTVYPFTLVMLRPLDAAEQTQLAPLVPGRLRARLGLPVGG